MSFQDRTGYLAEQKSTNSCFPNRCMTADLITKAVNEISKHLVSQLNVLIGSNTKFTSLSCLSYKKKVKNLQLKPEVRMHCSQFFGVDNNALPTITSIPRTIPKLHSAFAMKVITYAEKEFSEIHSIHKSIGKYNHFFKIFFSFTHKLDPNSDGMEVDENPISQHNFTLVNRINACYTKGILLDMDITHFRLWKQGNYG